MGQASALRTSRDSEPELLHTYRLYAALAGALIPLFWIAYALTDPTAVDPLWLRIVLTGAVFAAWLLSYRSLLVRRHFVAVMQGLLFLITAWFVVLTAINDFAANYAVGLLFVITAVAVGMSTGLREIRPLRYYLIASVALTALGALASPGGPDLVVFVGCTASIALVIHVAARETIRTNALLRRSEQTYRTLFASANDAILVVDPEELTILEANRKARDLYGFDHLTGIRVDALAPAPWFDAVPTENLELVHRRRDGTPVHLLVSTARIEFEGREAFLSIHRDVTERHRTMASLSHANEALSRRNRDLQDFTTAASHDLREPVRKFRTFTDLVRREYGLRLDETGRSYLDRLQEIGLQMSRIIDGLLAYARIAAEDRPRLHTDLTGAARAAVDDLQAEIARTGAHVEIDALPSALAEPDQMRTLFRELIANAIQSRRDDAPPRIHVSGSNREGAVIVRVRDNGVGIDARHADQIFSPFRHLESRRPRDRAGMGLPICKRIVEHHGGRITLESVPGEGSTFVIELGVDPAGSAPESREPSQP